MVKIWIDILQFGLKNDHKDQLRTETIYPTLIPDTENPNYTFVSALRWLCAIPLSSLAWLYFSRSPLPRQMAWLAIARFPQRLISSSMEGITDNLHPKFLWMLCLKILALLFIVDCCTVILTQSQSSPPLWKSCLKSNFQFSRNSDLPFPFLRHCQSFACCKQ